MSDDFFGQWGGPEGTPSNDPEQRGQADGDGQRPAVNSEGFDAKYMEDTQFKPNSVDNLPKSNMPNEFSVRSRRATKGYSSENAL